MNTTLTRLGLSALFTFSCASVSLAQSTSNPDDGLPVDVRVPAAKTVEVDWTGRVMGKRALTLADGSTVLLSHDTPVRVLSITETDVAVRLRNGMQGTLAVGHVLLEREVIRVGRVMPTNGRMLFESESSPSLPLLPKEGPEGANDPVLDQLAGEVLGSAQTSGVFQSPRYSMILIERKIADRHWVAVVDYEAIPEGPGQVAQDPADTDYTGRVMGDRLLTRADGSTVRLAHDTRVQIVAHGEGDRVWVRRGLDMGSLDEGHVLVERQVTRRGRATFQGGITRFDGLQILPKSGAEALKQGPAGDDLELMYLQDRMGPADATGARETDPLIITLIERHIGDRSWFAVVDYRPIPDDSPFGEGAPIGAGTQAQPEGAGISEALRKQLEALPR